MTSTTVTDRPRAATFAQVTVRSEYVIVGKNRRNVYLHSTIFNEGALLPDNYSIQVKSMHTAFIITGKVRLRFCQYIT